MWEVFIWVPTKGWKLVKSTPDKRRAVEVAKEFEPLEVKVSGGPHGDGRVAWGGKVCKVDYDTPCAPNNLDELLKA